MGLLSGAVTSLGVIRSHKSSKAHTYTVERSSHTTSLVKHIHTLLRDGPEVWVSREGMKATVSQGVGEGPT